MQMLHWLHKKSPPWVHLRSRKLLGGRAIHRKELGLILKKKSIYEDQRKLLIGWGKIGVCGKGSMCKEKKGKKKKRKVPQTQAHQAKWDKWLAYPPYA